MTDKEKYTIVELVKMGGIISSVEDLVLYKLVVRHVANTVTYYRQVSDESWIIFNKETKVHHDNF